MNTGKKIIHILFGILVITMLAVPTLVDAQSPTPYEELVAKIQARAQKDVEMGREPASIADLQTLFGDEAETVGMTMSEVLDIYETAYAEATPPKTWIDDLTPNAGWLAAAILFVLFILRDTLKDYLSRFVKWLTEGLYNHLAGYKPFWWIALRKYREALVETHQELKIPFRPGRPLKMGDVYVPLKVEGSNNQELLDAYKALSQHNRLMVVGAPGSGKTMLMRHIALTYARVGLNDMHGQPIPILLELHRLNDPKLSLLEHLTEALKRNNFPNGEKFIEAGLEHGNLMLLFDGFDEVNQDARGRVARQIKDFLNSKSNCRAVITCRTAVYNDEFADFSDQQLEIAEFNDQQIQRFLGTWETEMPADKSVKHLLKTLRERPRIMALARNPLLLTIIAYLYSDTAFILPHSRTEFYSRSTTVLLDQWDQFNNRQNKYKASHKRLILQALALYFQERASSDEQDRRSVDLVDALDQIEEVLPSLNLEPSHAQPMLDEIVERSGLVLALDGGTRYQFSHLTLQEFFAALALEGNPDRLIALFNADYATWRETVKLWCGLEHDSTDFLKAIEKINPIIALEALGDTQQVDSGYAEELINEFLSLLGVNPNSFYEELFEQALALIAADSRPRGMATLENLTATLSDTSISQETRMAAARILALSNLPEAAFVLAKVAEKEDAFQPFLAQMGDLAVPSLAKQAEAGEFWSLNALYKIGTPQAALALVPLLWEEKYSLQYHAAWRLGALISTPDVEVAMNEFSLSQEQKDSEYLDWVWEPFAPALQAPVRVIAGRIAHLLEIAPENTLPLDMFSLRVDQRLIIPLCGVKEVGGKFKIHDIEKDEKESLLEKLEEISNKLEDPEKDFDSIREWQSSIDEIIHSVSDKFLWSFLLHYLSLKNQIYLLRQTIKRDPILGRNDWKGVLTPIEYKFDKSLQARGFKLVLLVLMCIVLWQMGLTVLNASQLITWENGLILLLGLGLIGGIVWLVSSSLKSDIVWMMVYIISILIGIATGTTVTVLSRSWMTGALIGVLSASLLCVLVGILHGDTLKDILVAALATALVGALAGALGGILSVVLVFALGGLLFTIIIFAIGSVLGYTSQIQITLNKGAGDIFFFALLLMLFSALAGAIVGVGVYYPTVWLYEEWGWGAIGVFWFTWFVGFMGFSLWGKRLDRRAQNPLHGLLELDENSRAKYINSRIIRVFRTKLFRITLRRK